MKWKENLSLFFNELKGMPSVVESNEVSAPAKESDVEIIESQIKMALPPKFRKFLLESSAGIDVDWSFSDGALIQLEKRSEWIDYGGFSFHMCNFLNENPQFSDDFEPDDYDAEYRPEDLLALMSTENGDQFAVTLTGADVDAIKYLSHDLDDIHLYKVGDDIESFLDNYARIGFVGPEYWIWEQFTNNRTTPIDCKSQKATQFIDAIKCGRRSLGSFADRVGNP